MGSDSLNRFVVRSIIISVLRSTLFLIIALMQLLCVRGKALSSDEALVETTSAKGMTEMTCGTGYTYWI